MTRHTLPPLLLLLATIPASAQPAPPDLKGKTLAATFAELLPAMGAVDNGARQGAQQRWQDICFALSAPGSEKLREEACELMAAKLDDKTPRLARLWLLQQLQRIGKDECLNALTATLDDKDDEVREMAIRALANNSSPAATSKLVGAYAKASQKDKIGILNALGHRRDPSSAKDVAKALGGDPEIAVAATIALGRIPDGDAVDALVAALESKQAVVRRAAANAVLVHADRFLKEGNQKEAAKLYELLNNAREARPIRLAAIRGVILTSGDKAGDLVLSYLQGADARAKEVAVAQIEYLTPKALKTLCNNLDILPPITQVAVITAVAARGDRTQAPVAMEAARSKDPEVKKAGLHALGRLGDASTVEFLLEAMAGKEGANIAADSLAAIAAEGVNEKLIAVLETEKIAGRKVALIGILDRRKANVAVPALLKAAADADGGVRSAAFTALKGLAGPEHAPIMIEALLKTAKGGERDQAEQALVVVLAPVNAEKRAEPVLAVIRAATGAREADLLPLLGRLGGQDALRHVRERLASTMPLLHDAAFISLCNWPDASANKDLLEAAAKPHSPAEKARAIQALIRINAVLVDRTPEEKLAALDALKATMKLATSDDERRAILSGIGFVRHIDTLRYVVPFLDDPTLAQAACKGVVELAHSKMLREPNKAEFDKALDRVIAMCKDKGLVERAKNYKEGR